VSRALVPFQLIGAISVSSAFEHSAKTSALAFRPIMLERH